MKKILITGSCGFVGVNFVKTSFFLKKDYDFICVDNLSSERSKYNIYFNKNHVFQIADASSDLLDKIFVVYKPTHVLYLAGGSHHCYNNKPEYISALNNVLEISKKKSVVFNYLSSYRAGQQRENSIYCYTNNKTSIFETSEDVIMNSGVAFNIIKPVEIFGYKQSKNNLLPLLVSGSNVVLNSQGNVVREWIHINDVVSAITTIFDKNITNKIINVGSSYELSDLEFCQRVNKILKKDFYNVFFDKIKCDHEYKVDSSYIKSLGWSVESNFSKSLYDTIEWYKNNKWSLS